MSERRPTPFEPVIIGLTDQDDYAVLIEALDGYAASIDQAADQEDEAGQHADVAGGASKRRGSD